MRNAFLFLICMLSVACVCGQKEDGLNYRPLRTDSSSLQIYLLEDDSDNPKKICSVCTYHWLKAGQIQQTRGGFDGKLLHGTFTEYYKGGELKSKGHFEKGLKSGEWRMWFQNGELQKISHFKKGVLDGDEQVFDASGKLTQRNNYRNGMLHGEQITYTDSIPIVLSYKHGELRIKDGKTAPAKSEEPAKPGKKKEHREKSSGTLNRNDKARSEEKSTPEKFPEDIDKK